MIFQVQVVTISGSLATITVPITVTTTATGGGSATGTGSTAVSFLSNPGSTASATSTQDSNNPNNAGLNTASINAAQTSSSGTPQAAIIITGNNQNGSDIYVVGNITLYINTVISAVYKTVTSTYYDAACTCRKQSYLTVTEYVTSTTLCSTPAATTPPCTTGNAPLPTTAVVASSSTLDIVYVTVTSLCGTNSIGGTSTSTSKPTIMTTAGAERNVVVGVLGVGLGLLALVIGL